jgi:hypothetical protein
MKCTKNATATPQRKALKINTTRMFSNIPSEFDKYPNGKDRMLENMRQIWVVSYIFIVSARINAI